jgi:hypothetical protein
VYTDLGVKMTIPVITSYESDLPVIRLRFKARFDYESKIDTITSTADVTKGLADS